MDEQTHRKLLRVVSSGNCAGCGACAAAFGEVTMSFDGAGFLRPTIAEDARQRPSGPSGTAFDDYCPGVALNAPPQEGGARDAVLGNHLGVWRAWATDPDLRHRGSSGGVLTALAVWLLESGRGARVVAAQADRDDARFTAAVTADDVPTTRASAGSRYAPVAVAAQDDAYLRDSVVVAKPCEISAIRRRTRDEPDRPVLLSFFCAGTPSQRATDETLAGMHLDVGRPLRSLRYRGHGWPGRFAAEDAGGRRASLTYEDSWGAHLGKALQWRCKVCVDGVGEDADVVAADYWSIDERGYPRFGEAAGVSALIARTPRGRDIVQAAVAAGVLAVEPATMRDLAARQPYQVRRRVTLLARTIGTRLAGRPVPRYRGYGLLGLVLRDPARSVVDGWGALRRAVRAQRAAVARQRSGHGS